MNLQTHQRPEDGAAEAHARIYETHQGATCGMMGLIVNSSGCAFDAASRLFLFKRADARVPFPA